MPRQEDINIEENKIRLETVKCELCGGEDSALFLNSCNIRQGCKKEYKVVRCKNCGLCFLNPRPTKDSIRHYYLESDKEKLPRRPAMYERFYFNLFRKIPSKEKGTLLDVGCGSGRYISVLEEKGWDVKGVDVGYTDYGRDVLGLDIYEGGLLEANFHSESFNAVTFWWTLEHMHDPLIMLKEAHRILKRDGVVIVGVPNINSLEAKIFNRHWFHLFLPKHLYQFSTDSLIRILNKAGFKNVEIRHDLFSFGIIGSLQCLFNSKGINISLNNPLFYILSLPIDVILGIARVGGLITAYAYKD